MPPRNVKLRGSFERIDYEVSYQFQGNVLPPSWENLIPEASRHYPGDIVEVAPNPVAEGFEFLGWYKAESFEMPEEDVVITGEWKEKLGTFTPKITKVIDNEKVSYQEGDVVNFSITVENTANFEINDVFIQEETEGAEFVPDENNKYTVLNENYVKIPKMDPLESLVIKAKYVVQKDAVKRVTNKVSLVGAIASNKYTLAEGEYTSSVDFVVSNVVLNINKVSGEGKKLNGAEFTLYEDEGTQTVYGTGMSFKGLTPGKTYYLKETKVPYGYVKLNKVLYVSVDEAGSISIAGYEVTNVDGVATVNIANEKIDVLPNTGGVGNVPFVIGGLVIIVIAAFGCGYWFRKGKKKK